MFDLEPAIAAWRQQMLAAGIKTPALLEELEGHLREEIGQQMESGMDPQAAFTAASRQIGQASMLKSEFTKVGGAFSEQLKQFIFTLAGVPNPQLVTDMNTSHPNLEPRWSTYLKSAALILPAIVVWVGASVFIWPKLKEVCAASGTAFPRPVVTALALSEYAKNHLIVGAVLVLAVLVLLERRSSRWPRYRRMVFGLTAFSVNLIALTMTAAMMVLAVIAAANLLPHVK